MCLWLGLCPGSLLQHPQTPKLNLWGPVCVEAKSRRKEARKEGKGGIRGEKKTRDKFPSMALADDVMKL